MNRQTLDYVRYRAARAEEALQVARRALDDGALHETEQFITAVSNQIEKQIHADTGKS